MDMMLQAIFLQIRTRRCNVPTLQGTGAAVVMVR